MPASTTDLKSQIQGDVPEGNVRNHLKVLGVFFHLLESVPRRHATDEESLDEFFHRATYRLQLWVERIINMGREEQPLHENELPPLDVALALHSLMLSPHRYFEDSELRFRQLKRLREYPLDLMVAAFNASYTGYEKMIQESVYREYTPAAYERQPGSETFPTNLAQSNTAVLVRGELDVQSRCPTIVDEVWKCLEDKNGQLLTLEDLAILATNEGQSIMAYIAKRLTRSDSALRMESIPMLLRAFDHLYPFTQDVVDAVVTTIKLKHQHPFIRTTYRQGWSRANSAGPSDSDLDIAHVQYENFLRRIMTPDRREPGWKDDLIWHTHQLMPERYRVNIVSYIGVFLDHLPAGEDVNGYRPRYDKSRNLHSVSIWIECDGEVSTKGNTELGDLRQFSASLALDAQLVAPAEFRIGPIPSSGKVGETGAFQSRKTLCPIAPGEAWIRASQQGWRVFARARCAIEMRVRLALILDQALIVLKTLRSSYWPARPSKMLNIECLMTLESSAIFRRGKSTT
ncbi:hypothetical protein EYR38_010842 [Pleurotus pulmonarius]|nr:hypothetical protein EYR38_010842 [Pleurotus pulmonarius]